LEELVREYLGDIADLLKADKRLLDELLRNLNMNTI